MLIGRLTNNPDQPRTLPNSGSTAIRFRLAVGRSRKNPQTGQWENDPNVLYIDCEAYSRPDAKRNLVDVIQRFVKQGDQVFIEGRLQLDEWTDKTSGQPRSKHKVVVDSVELLGGKSDDTPRTGASDLTSKHDQHEGEDENTNDLPF
jgi:single-strand DNA-binding protein